MAFLVAALICATVMMCGCTGKGDNTPSVTPTEASTAEATEQPTAAHETSEKGTLKVFPCRKSGKRDGGSI